MRRYIALRMPAPARDTGRFDWLVGLYYTDSHQDGYQYLYYPGIAGAVNAVTPGMGDLLYPNDIWVDVVWDAYCDLVGRPNPIHVNCQDDDVRWQLLVRDLVSGWHFRRRGDLSRGEFWRTVLDPRRKEYAVLSWRDPGAVLGYPLNTLWKWWESRARE